MRGFLQGMANQKPPEGRRGRGQGLISEIHGPESPRERTRAVRDRAARPRTLAWASLSATLLLSIGFGPSVSAAAEVSRTEYVDQLEKICKPDAEATERAVRGTRIDVRAERLRQAASKVAKAQKIFSGTVGSIAKVPRPAADTVALSRWFTALGREATTLGRTAASLRAEDIPRFQRLWGDFIHDANKANNVVVSFGFNYCNFKASRFE